MDSDTQKLLRDLLRFTLAAMVNRPEDIKLKELVGSRTMHFEVTVHDLDVGLVLGVRGANINAIRTVLQAVSKRVQVKCTIEVITNLNRRTKTA